jgi:hypothetical protein
VSGSDRQGEGRRFFLSEIRAMQMHPALTRADATPDFISGTARLNFGGHLYVYVYGGVEICEKSARLPRHSLMMRNRKGRVVGAKGCLKYLRVEPVCTSNRL